MLRIFRVKEDLTEEGTSVEGSDSLIGRLPPKIGDGSEEAPQYGSKEFNC